MHLANKNGYTFICYYSVQTTPKPRQQGNPRCSWTAPRAGAGIPPAFIMTIGPNFQSLG
jgi:hypothetical protein